MIQSDIAIAQQATLRRIVTLGQERLGLTEDELIPYGHYKAKVSLAEAVDIDAAGRFSGLF